MEIEIDSKKNNPLLNRTEINFTIKHTGEKTPNREVIRAELADKLNVKKDDVIVDFIHTTFGVQQVTGYAKVYSSADKLKGLEREHILVRNKLMQATKKKDKKEGATAPKQTEVAKEVPKPAKEAPKTESPKKETKEQPPGSVPKEKKE